MKQSSTIARSFFSWNDSCELHGKWVVHNTWCCSLILAIHLTEICDPYVVCRRFAWNHFSFLFKRSRTCTDDWLVKGSIVVRAAHILLCYSSILLSAMSRVWDLIIYALERILLGSTHWYCFFVPKDRSTLSVPPMAVKSASVELVTEDVTLVRHTTVKTIIYSSYRAKFILDLYLIKYDAGHTPSHWALSPLNGVCEATRRMPSGLTNHTVHVFLSRFKTCA
jgi:hypothetical protein